MPCLLSTASEPGSPSSARARSTSSQIASAAAMNADLDMRRPGRPRLLHWGAHQRWTSQPPPASSVEVRARSTSTRRGASSSPASEAVEHPDGRTTELNPDDLENLARRKPPGDSSSTQRRAPTGGRGGRRGARRGVKRIIWRPDEARQRRPTLAAAQGRARPLVFVWPAEATLAEALSLACDQRKWAAGDSLRRRRRRRRRRRVSDRDDFVAWTQSRLRDAETALHNGDPGPRLAIWSTREPVTVLGAWSSAVGQEALRDLFHNLADTFSNCTSHVYEIVAADVVGDMAFTVGYEQSRLRSTASRVGTSSV